MSGHLSSDTVDACHVTTGQDNPPSLEGGVFVLSQCQRGGRDA